MDRIVLEINDFAANKWRAASNEEKDKLTATISLLVQNALKKKDEDFWKFLNKVSDEAIKNGLTEEKLNDILSE